MGEVVNHKGNVFTDSIMNMNAEKVVADISVPLFIGHGKDNLLHPLESTALFVAATEPKRLYLIDGKHNDFMYHNHPLFQELVANLNKFFNRHITVAEKVKVKVSV